MSATGAFESLLINLGETRSPSEGIASLLNDLQLPVPEENEFLQSGKGALIFHPDAGIVARIEKGCHTLDHPLTAPVIGRWSAGDYTVSLVAGGRTSNVSDDEAEWLEKTFSREAYRWTDAKANNVMRLPLKTERHPQGLPVIADLDHLAPNYDAEGTFVLAAPLVYVFHHLQRAVTHTNRPMQYEDYGVTPAEAGLFRSRLDNLRTLLRASWPDDVNGSVDPAAMKAFWNQATADTHGDNPVLAQGWNEPVDQASANNRTYTNRDPFGNDNGHGKARRAAIAARNYALHIRSLQPS